MSFHVDDRIIKIEKDCSLEMKIESTDKHEEKFSGFTPEGFEIKDVKPILPPSCGDGGDSMSEDKHSAWTRKDKELASEIIRKYKKQNPCMPIDLPYQCNDCNQKFKFKVNLVKHIQTSHKAPKIKKVLILKCDHCDWTGVSASQLNFHIRTHTKGKFKC